MSYAIKGSWAHDIESIKASDLPKCRGDWESKKFVRKVQSHIPKIKPRRNYWCGPYAMAVLTNTRFGDTTRPHGRWAWSGGFGIALCRKH